MALPEFSDYTLMVHVPRDLTEYTVIGDAIAAIINKSARLETYWFHFEIGDAKSTPHLQGWVTSNYTDTQFNNTRDNVLRKYLSKNFKKKYSFYTVNFQNYKSYCANNKGKVLEEKIWTNIEEDIIESLPTYEKFEIVKKNNNSSFVKKLYERLEAKVVSKGLTGGYTISYKMIPVIMLDLYGDLYKDLDASIFRKHMLGVTNCLERKYTHKTTKVKNDFVMTYLANDIRKNDEELYLKMFV